MANMTKIATCCHCGTKAMLTLDAGRHELSCASCGAPLRDLKRVPKPKAPARKAVSHVPDSRSFREPPRPKAPKKPKPRKIKRRTRWLKKVAEEIFDIVEDVFD